MTKYLIGNSYKAQGVVELVFYDDTSDQIIKVVKSLNDSKALTPNAGVIND